MAKQELAIVKTFDNHPALVNNLAEVIQANLGDEGLRFSDLTTIKVPTGGMTKWAIQTLAGEDYVDEIKGIIIAQKKVRAYWEKDFGQGESTLPDCASDNGRIGKMTNPEKAVTQLGGLCETCPMAQYGSGKDGGKACTERLLIVILVEGEVLPSVVSVSPGSLKNAREYFTTLTKYNAKYHTVLTSFKLKKAQSKSNIDYSQIVFSFAGIIPKETAAVVEEFKREFDKSINALSINDITNASVEDDADFKEGDVVESKTTKKEK